MGETRGACPRRRRGIVLCHPHMFTLRTFTFGRQCPYCYCWLTNLLKLNIVKVQLTVMQQNPLKMHGGIRLAFIPSSHVHRLISIHLKGSNWSLLNNLSLKIAHLNRYNFLICVCCCIHWASIKTQWSVFYYGCTYCWYGHEHLTEICYFLNTQSLCALFKKYMWKL